MGIQNEQYVVRHHGTEKRYQYSELISAIRTGLLPLSAECLIDGVWYPLPEREEFRNECSGDLVQMVKRLDANSIPICTLFCSLLLVVGNWIQNEHVVSILGNGWSNVVLEGRWWGSYTYVLLHSSKIHFMSNLVLFLFLGWRVEHAMGGVRLLVLLCATMIFSSWGIWYWGEGRQVVGSSSLVFALWGAQILIGFLFSLPPRHELRYGWWGLMLLMCIFSIQIGKEGLAHLVHGCSILVGFCFVFSLYRIRFPLVGWAVGLLVGMLFGTNIFETSILKKEQVDGMSVYIPKDFLSYRIGKQMVWFHPFQTSGWLVQGVSVGEERFSYWWQKRGFTRKEKEENCMEKRRCSFEKGDEEALTQIVHRGRNIYWFSCVFSKKNQVWKDRCFNWMDRIEAIMPYSLQQAKIKFEELPHSVYYMEGYGVQLENVGRYEEADSVYQLLQNTDWNHRGLQYRERLRTDGLIE